MTDYDDEVVGVIAELPLEEIQGKLQEMMDANSPEATEYFIALFEKIASSNNFEEITPWALKFYRFAATNNVIEDDEFAHLREASVRFLHLKDRNQDALFILREMEDICIRYGKDQELIKVLISQCEQQEDLGRLEEIQEIADRAISLGNILQEFNLVAEAAMHAAMSFFNRDADALNDLTNNRIAMALEYAEIAYNRFIDCGESSAAADSAWVVSRSLESLGEFESALDFIERGIYSYEDTRNTPEHVLSRTLEYELQRGRMLRMVGRLEEAEATLDKILTHKDVQDQSKLIQSGTLIFMLIPLAHLALGWTRYDLRNFELAWANFSQAAQQFYNVDTHHLLRADYGRAQILAAANEFDESLEICKNILEKKSNIFPLDEASKEKNRGIGMLRSFTLQHLARLNNYGGLGYGRFKTTPNQEKEIEWTTKLLMVNIQRATGQLGDAMKTFQEIEVIRDFLPTQNQLDKLSLVKAQLLIQLERTDEAKQTLQEIEAFGEGYQKDQAIKIIQSLETFELHDSAGDRLAGSKTWKQAEPVMETQN